MEGTMMSKALHFHKIKYDIAGDANMRVRFFSAKREWNSKGNFIFSVSFRHSLTEFFPRKKLKICTLKSLHKHKNSDAELSLSFEFHLPRTSVLCKFDYIYFFPRFLFSIGFSQALSSFFIRF